MTDGGRPAGRIIHCGHDVPLRTGPAVDPLTKAHRRLFSQLVIFTATCRASASFFTGTVTSRMPAL
jgi:hypothetical protein